LAISFIDIVDIVGLLCPPIDEKNILFANFSATAFLKFLAKFNISYAAVPLVYAHWPLVN